MADIDGATIGLILAAIGAAVLGFFELRILRKKMNERRVRVVKGASELPDEAHNAIITTKAILDSLERQGIQSPEVRSWMKEADVAYERHNYRVALELVGRAKNRLLTLKAESASKGEIAKLEHLSSASDEGQVTTKEVVQKEIAPNLPQSKFSIEVASSAIELARGAGRDVAKAAEFLDAAKSRFEARDYDGALTLARLSKRSAEGQKVEAPATPAPKPMVTASTPSKVACPTCGAALASDDAFCRKCGTRLEGSACTTCGAALLADDAFCPKCGARVST
ncbi:MAG: zinc ribbon domain-containing protein [Methanobacteriota archaeon]|nr:MAG: zinc ribbon domain-containing protein [Euryarchaeota archaeon]